MPLEGEILAIFIYEFEESYFYWLLLRTSRMSNLGEGSTSRRKSIWDMDDPAHFEVPICTNVATGNIVVTKKKKKPRTAYDKDPMYLPPSYTRYAYEVSLQWYARKST